MSTEIRSRIARELDALGEPPSVALVGGALRDGRRRHRRRQLGQGAATLGAAAAVLVTALVVPQLVGGGGTQQVVAASSTVTAVPRQTPDPAATAAPTAASGGDETTGPDASAPTRTVGSPSGRAAPTPTLSPAARTVTAAVPPHSTPTTSSAVSDGPVATTPTGLLQQVSDLLPSIGLQGPIQGARAGDGRLMVQAGLVKGGAKTMFRIEVATGGTGPVVLAKGETMRVLKDGTRLVTGGLADNCIQHRYVSAHRPDGLVVMVLLPTCLAWNGTGNPPAVQAMTVAQATTLATDPTIGLTVEAAVAAAGQAAFADLPTFG